MKRGQFILVVALIFGVCMFFGARYWLPESRITNVILQEKQSLLPELEWLRQKFRLDEVQFEKVKALHLAYRPTCQAFCKRAAESEMALLQVMHDPTMDATEALKSCAELHVECQQAMLTHVRQTAACMNGGQAKQYLDTVLPHVLGHRLSMDPDSPSSR